MTVEDAPIGVIEIKGAFVQNAVITVEFEDGIYRDTENMRFQWYRNDVPENFGGEPILGAARSKYTLTSEDVGKYLYVSIPDVYIAGDNPSDKIPAVSSVTDKISDSIAELKSISIDKNNEIVRNKEIRVIAAQPENALAKVQWYRNDVQSNISGEPILGANYETYVPVAADVGKYLYCVYDPVYPFSGEPVVSEVSETVKSVAVVLFDPNGGYYGGICAEVSEGSAVGTLENAIRDGYTFKGWATDPYAKSPDFTEEYVVAEDMTVYAVWEAESVDDLKYTVERVTVSEDFQNNGEVEVSLTNQYGAGGCLIIALYDENGVLVNTIIDEEFPSSVSNGGTEVYAGKFDNPKRGHSVQAFIWDDMQFMKPLFNVGRYRL